MYADSTVEYNSLSWVKKQLDDVLAEAQSDLGDYIETGDDARIQSCLENLKLVYGTLQMVEVYGASMLTEEMQETVKAVQSGSVEQVDDAFDVLMRAMLQLPDYLENIQAGKKDTPIVLMPLMNDLRAARNEPLLSESVLFVARTEDVELPAQGYDVAAIKKGQLEEDVGRLRTHFQVGLLDYIRNGKEEAGLQRIQAVLYALEKATCNDRIRRVWMVAGALIEGLVSDGIDSNISVKMLLGSLDRQMKRIMDIGEEAYAEECTEDLLRNMLYYIGGCETGDRRVATVKDAFDLKNMQTSVTDADKSLISGLNADLFETVSRGITEDIFRVKDTLEIFMHNQTQNPQDLAVVSEQMGKIADTFGMLSMGTTRQNILEQRDVLERIIQGEETVSESLVLGIAEELLGAESDLKAFIGRRSGYVDVEESEDQIVPAAEYRQVILTVVDEALKNFSLAKDALLLHISDAGDDSQLAIILEKLEEVRGVALMLPLSRIESQIERLQDYVRIVLQQNRQTASAEEQDAVADVVTSIEYYLEALAEGRPGVESGLETGDAAAEKLGKMAASFDTGNDVASDDADGETPPASVTTGQRAGDEHEKAESHDAEATEKTLTERFSADVDYEILSDDADAEIVEIFIEEAVEVLGEMHSCFPRWRDNNQDEEALLELRRSFHTLKGSGRLIGAELIGEFAWKFENVLNRVIDNKVEASPELLNAVDEALAVLPQLVEQLQGNREPVQNIYPLMATVDALAEGRALPSVDEPVAEITPPDIVPSAEETGDADSGGAVAEASPETAAEVVDDDADAGADTVVQPSGERVDAPVPAFGEDDEAPDIDRDASPAAEVTAIPVAEAPTGDDASVASTASGSPDDASAPVPGDDLEAPFTGIGAGQMDASMDMDETEDELESGGAASAETVSGADTGVTGGEGSEDGPEEEEIVLDVTELTETVPGDEADGDTYVIEIDEDDEDEDETGMDPMLRQIYFDESMGHLETIRQKLAECDHDRICIAGDDEIFRALHTLSGSARTAEVMPVAELAGSYEKFLKEHRDGRETALDENAIVLLDELQAEITSMLEQVRAGRMPDHNKALHERIQALVQQEMQSQLQQSVEQEPEQEPFSPAAMDSGVAPGTEPAESVTESAAEAVPDTEAPVSSGDEDDAPSGTPPDGDAATATDDDVLAIRYDEIDDDLIEIFLEEAEELLEACENTILAFEDTPDSAEHIHDLQRHMHTLKGGARMADLTPVGNLTHVLESLVVLVSDRKVDADKGFFDVLHESLDRLNEMMTQVKARQPLHSPAALIGRINEVMQGVSADEVLADLPDEAAGTVVRPAADAATGTDGDDTENDETTPHLLEKGSRATDRPHWGERASDVNFVESQELVRVRSDLLNNLVNYAGEVNIYHARLGKQVADFSFNLSELSQTVVRLKEQLRKLEIETEIQIRSGYEKEAQDYDEGFDPLEMDRYSTLQQLSRSLMETASDVESINDILTEITRDSETLLLQESRVSTDLQEGLMRTRMVRFGGLSSRLRRIVRQIARELDKEVELKLVGEDSEVDRTILDRIIAPLEHMLRNSVAHGIESPEARREAGKPETGAITVTVGRQGTDVILNVKDDGRGLDVQAIREKAIANGLLDASLSLPDHEILQFILQSGFSTAKSVTQVSGRGVGMDVVDTEIKQLGGVLEIDSEPGKGVSFNIRLPLTLAINQALLVQTGEDIYAVPLASIEGVVRLTGPELQSFYESENSFYEFNGVEYELKHLGSLLGGNRADYSRQLHLFPVLLARVGEQNFALHVDDLLGRREIVVKPVGMQIGSVRGIAGATILADGRVVLILEMSALVAGRSLFRAGDDHQAEETGRQKSRMSIMVVDDSITIRKVTERILGRNGFDVILAKDGIDATNKMQDHIPDLMLLDIEMPRMDGFEVARYVRNDDRLKDLPIIMITSRTGSKHKEKALEIGVNQYLGKPYQEEELMNNINAILA